MLGPWTAAIDPEDVWKDVGEGGVIQHEQLGRCVVLALWKRPDQNRKILWYVTVPDIGMKMFSTDCEPFNYRLILDPDAL